jgi:SAM-dependent methyltransferase
LDRSTLELSGSLLTAVRGTTSYEVCDGIPQFLRFPPAEDVRTRERLEELNRVAEAAGWREAIATIFSADAGMVRYVTETGRAAFLDLLGLDKSRDVLEIGPGLGQFTVELARRARSVSALEVVPGQARFVVQRVTQEGCANVRVAVGGDDCRLPYPDRSFDVVVLNLVFEWCASRCSDEDMATVQRRLLSEMARVLRPSGILYLATKNRFALRYLIGKRDEHVHDLRFGNALPRWLLRLVLRTRGLPRPPGLLHSYNELRKMLAEVGFGSFTTYWATPEMRYPTDYVLTDAKSIRTARARAGFVQGDGRMTRALMRGIPAPWVRHLTPGLAFVARKAPEASG